MRYQIFRHSYGYTCQLPAAYKSVHHLFNVSTLKTQAKTVHTICCDCGKFMDEKTSADECMHSYSIQYHELPLDVQVQALFEGTLPFMFRATYTPLCN